ncbi:MAG: SDR family oxidoreductase [Acidobacteriales bacterium]|nr:SDR family oxidoreductase [Terriglobales bacterium]
MRSLKGKTVLVTGGARRIGRAIALRLADAGADVAITFLSSSREAQRSVVDLSSLGVRALSLRCDVRDEQQIKATLKELIREFGRLDILINNAANYETVDFEKITPTQWDDMFATNTRAPYLVSRVAVPELRKQKGRIVNLGSLGGQRPWVDHAHYCASKAALEMVNRLMAKAYAPEIAVNCVAPGMIDLGEKKPSAFMQKLAKKTPMKRNGTAEDVAEAVLFFATAPHFITGQTLVVDGGLGLVS